MKLYLSSYRLSDDSGQLTRMVSGGGHIAVIRNALDFSTDSEKLKEGKEREFEDMCSLGLKPSELDLKSFFGKHSDLLKELKSYDGVWVVGGNAFILRRAMRESGLDDLLKSEALGPEFVYAGYSAGACAVSLTLRGLHNVDFPDDVPEGYPEEPIWDGVGLLPFAIAPHYRSSHPESTEIENSVTYLIDHRIPFVALRDGDAYIGETRGGHLTWR